MTYNTFQHEEGLPHLPVPPLLSTVKQFLTAIKPLVSSDEYSQLLDESSEFLSHDLILLIQKHLQALSSKHSCYLNTIHNEIYSDLRGDVLPRNPYLVLEEDPYAKTLTPPNQSQRASTLVNSALKFIISLRNHTLKPDLTPKNSNPLTMECYYNLFGTTRIPGDNTSAVKTCRDSRHIVVISNNQYYSLEVLPENSNEIYFNDYELSLIFQNIITEAEQVDQIVNINNSFGSITTQTFKYWKLGRQELHKSNTDILQAIDDALFLVVLDVNSPTTVDEKISIISNGSSELMPGTNIQIGSCTSRWYDKLQLITTKNSVAGFVWDSVSMDSTAILRFISDIYTDSILKLAKNINGSEYTLFDIDISFVLAKQDKPGPNLLKFVQTKELSKLIHHSETRLTDLINQHEYKNLHINIDTHLVKKFDISIDSFLQVCFQMTYYSLYGKMVNSLEPVTTRKFKNARTELITVQNDSIERLVKMVISNTTSQEKWNLFKDCCQSHTKQYLNAMNGLGFDRHFVSFIKIIKSKSLVEYLNKENSDLENIPTTYNTDIPLLSNPLIERLTLPELLVSNCGNNAVHLFGIPPAIDQGFSIGYIVHSDKIIITVSSKFRQTERFLDTFEKIAADFKNLILANSKDFLIDINDSNMRKLELSKLKIQKELDQISDLPSRKHPIEIALNMSSPMSTNGLSVGSQETTHEEFDLLGGYGYFDFGELGSRSATISRKESELVMASEMKQRGSLSERIRDRMDLED